MAENIRSEKAASPSRAGERLERVAAPPDVLQQERAALAGGIMKMWSAAA
jgi:hypothetical protein